MNSYFNKISKISLALLFFVQIPFFIFSIEQQDLVKNPLLVLVLMVKNEANVMLPTLQPFLDAGVQSYLILDTGSTDGTPEITREIFRDYGVQDGYVFQEPFVDFATSRNRALELAEQTFPNATFFFMIDAEWYVKNVSKLLEFCEKHRNTQDPAFLVNIGNHTFNNYQCRLFRADKKIRYVGVVHEYANVLIKNKVDDAVFIEYRPSAQGVEQSKRRYSRDRDLLLQEYQRNPQDARTVFYLAQTYDCLGDTQNALAWYLKRCECQGWDQENYIAFYRVATVYERLSDWANALVYYIKAYSLRPNRVEPLVRIAQHYLSTGEYAACMLFAQQAAAVPYPTTDILFVDTILYSYVRWDILGRVAWYAGRYDLAQQAANQIVKFHSDNQATA